MNVMSNDLKTLIPDTQKFLRQEMKQFIGGEWVASSNSDTFSVIDPSSAEVLAQVPKGNAEDIDAAVQAANTAFNDPLWRDMPPANREKLMHRFADLIEGHAEELGQLEALDVGMPSFIGQHVEVGNVLDTLRYMAGWPTKINGRTMNIGEPMPEKRFFAYTCREPVGVVGAIVPWNVPLMIAMWKIAPALATGCTIVIKPSEVTPLATLRLAELAVDAGIPTGVINVVNGLGHEAGQALVEHPLVNKISFTGSAVTGKAINRTATETLKNVTLELGGKSPVILLDDANLDKAVQGISMGIFGNTGQVCVAGSRLYIQRGIFDKAVDRLTKEARSLKVGPGLHPETKIGPLVSEAHRDKVVGLIKAGVKAGGEVVTGGNLIDGPGYYVEPTVLINPPQSSQVVQEEIFGPVITAIPFDDIDGAAALANDTTYGLSSYVWSKDIQRVHQLVPKIRAGQVYVNSSPFPHPAMPMGGYRQSGIGRDLGEEAINHYTEHKSVVIGIN
jgi:phenylacetaldehyde dehydrogenase